MPTHLRAYMFPFVRWTLAPAEINLFLMFYSLFSMCVFISMFLARALFPSLSFACLFVCWFFFTSNEMMIIWMTFSTSTEIQLEIVLKAKNPDSIDGTHSVNIENIITLSYDLITTIFTFCSIGLINFNLLNVDMALFFHVVSNARVQNSSGFICVLL